MSLSAHARSLACLFLDANAFRFASGDVHAESGRARAAPSPSAPDDTVQVAASVDAEGGPTLARLHGLYVPTGRPLRAPAVTDAAHDLVLTPPSND